MNEELNQTQNPLPVNSSVDPSVEALAKTEAPAKADQPPAPKPPFLIIGSVLIVLIVAAVLLILNQQPSSTEQPNLSINKQNQTPTPPPGATQNNDFADIDKDLSETNFDNLDQDLNSLNSDLSGL